MRTRTLLWSFITRVSTNYFLLRWNMQARVPNSVPAFDAFLLQYWPRHSLVSSAYRVKKNDITFMCTLRLWDMYKLALMLIETNL